MRACSPTEAPKASEIMQAHHKAYDLPGFLQREWLEVNRFGTYASSTLIDCPTRRYHGLLITDGAGLANKMVLLAKLDASVVGRGRDIDLYTFKFPGGKWTPEGYTHIEQVRYDLCPHILFRVGPLLIQRSVLLLYDSDTVLVRFDLLEGEECLLHLRPLLAYRDHHQLERERAFHVKTFPIAEGWKIEPLPGKPPLFLQANRDVQFYPGPYWQKNIEYEVEQERGFDYSEDLFCPGLFAANLHPEKPLILAAGLEPQVSSSLDAQWQQEIQRREELRRRFQSHPPEFAALAFEAEKCLIERRDGKPSVVAGYPWFGEWGRDTMIALPGLTLNRQEPERFLAIIDSFLARARQGQVPNFLGADPSHDNFGSIDAALWLFAALGAYREQGYELEALRLLHPKLRELLDDLLEGRCPHAYCTEDGLLSAGDPSTQLTWMDARVHGQAVTPRHGLAVEINALWIYARRFMLELEATLGIPSQRSELLALETLPAAFRRHFWLPEQGYLADTVDPVTGEQNLSLRPNQIFALSLIPFALSHDEGLSALKQVTAELITPYGLRTLSPRDADFRPFYVGSPAERDGAYHQGTVWPWLAYAYARAYVHYQGAVPATRRFLFKNFSSLWTTHYRDAGIGLISEVFDALPPYAPNGCILQAWSIAETLRLFELIQALPESSR